MAWFRLHEGTSLDVKWPLIARKTNTNVGTVVAVWTAMLDYASQHKDRGTIAGFDCEAIDAFYGFEDGICQSVFDALVAKGMIKDGKITNWEKRQPKKEDENAALRKHQQRERENTQRTPDVTNADAQSQPVTQCHDASHDVTLDKIRIDKNIKGNLNTPPHPPRGESFDSQKPPEISSGTKQPDEPSRRRQGCDSVAMLEKAIDDYTPDEELRKALKDFRKMRERIRKPLTMRALQSAFAKLYELAGYDKGKQVAILDQSIFNSWQGLFPLPDESRPNSRASPAPERKTYAQLEQEDWEKRLKEAEEYDRQRREATDGKAAVLAQAG